VTPRTFNLALVGFGNVGRAFVRLLREKEQRIRDEYGVAARITGVATRRLGWLANPEGLDTAALPDGRTPACVKCAEVREWLRAARAGVLLEASSLNKRDGQPAIEYLRAALEHGAHAVSANKGPLVFAYDELRALAREKRRRFLFESTVMDGTPVFNLFRETLPVAGLRGFRGLLNSTSNVVLAEIEAGRTLAEAVRRAQEIGVAETDPTDDLEGWDAAVKVVALARVLMDAPLRLDQVERVGIASISPEQARAARAAGKPYKLICRAERRGGTVHASVRPEQVPLTDPLASLIGTTSCLHFDLDVFGLTLIEHKPGVEATAYGLLSDFLRAVREPEAL
jgi:homoserine dehydrogenase